MPRSRTSRREFLRTSATIPAMALLAPGLAADDKKRSPNEKLNLGVVGVAAQGKYNFDNVKHENIVAICDVDEARAAPARQECPKATFTQDFRRLLDIKNLDAVVVATPDHAHAVITLAALRRGLHVYCEKPLAHSVREVRLVRETAAKMNAITQMGTQIHAGDNYRQVVELVKGGAIGTVSRVQVWCDRRPNMRRVAKVPEMVPGSLAYDLWLGPAADRPYSSAFLPFHWRWFWNFGGGVLADMACHFCDLPFWALDLKAPTRIAATGTPPSIGDQETTETMQVDYEFPGVKLSWYHGVDGPDLEGKRKYPGYGSGVLFEGDKGELVADYNRHALLPEAKFRDFVPPSPSIPRSIGHHREWLNAIRTGKKSTCDFAYSGLLTEAVLLGNVAYRAGEPINWASATGKVSGSSRAEQFMFREYRKGWSLEG